MKFRHLLIGVLLLLFALALTACSSSAPPAETTPCPEVPACPDCPQVSLPRLS